MLFSFSLLSGRDICIRCFSFCQRWGQCPNVQSESPSLNQNSYVYRRMIDDHCANVQRLSIYFWIADDRVNKTPPRRIVKSMKDSSSLFPPNRSDAWTRWRWWVTPEESDKPAAVGWVAILKTFRQDRPG